MNQKGIKSTPDIKELSFIQNFIKDNDIKDGKTCITTARVYAFYCEQNRPPLPRRIFTRYFSYYFKRGMGVNVQYYKLDPAPFNLPPNYSIWRGKRRKKFTFKKSKYKNVIWTPEGWMAYIDLPGRKIIGFYKQEYIAAKMADQTAKFYLGDNYQNFNFKQIKTEGKELLGALRTIDGIREKTQKTSV